MDDPGVEAAATVVNLPTSPPAAAARGAQPTQDADAAALERIAGGDAGAFDELVDR